MDEQEISLQELWQTIVSHARLIVGITVIAMVAAFTVSCLMTPIYEAETTFLLNSKASSFSSPISLASELAGGLGGLAGGGLSNQAMNYAQIIKSRTSLEKTLARLGLEPGVNAPTMKKLSDAINVQSIAKTDAVKLTVQLADKNMARDLANTLIDVLVEQDRNMSQSAARSARVFLAIQVEDARLKLLEAEERLLAVKSGKRIVAPTAETEALLKRLVELGLQQATIDITVEQLRAGAGKAREQLAGMSETIVSSETIVEDPIVRDYRTRLANLELSLASAREKYTDKHPEVQRLTTEIEKVKANLAGAVANVVGSQVSTPNPMREELLLRVIEDESAVTAARAQQQAMGELIAKEEAKLDELPEKELSLARVMREFELAQQIYIMLRTKYEEARLTEQMQVSDIFPLDAAITPEKRVKPRKMLNTAIAMVLGMFVGVGAAFVAEFSDPSFKTAEEIERSLGLPILGAVPAHAGMPGANPGRRKRKA